MKIKDEAIAVAAAERVAAYLDHRDKTTLSACVIHSFDLSPLLSIALGASDLRKILAENARLKAQETVVDRLEEMQARTDERSTMLKATAQPEIVDWRPLVKAGQVKVGDKLRFKIGDNDFFQRAKLILHAGTDKEEVIYDKGRNFYFITSMVISGKSNHKSVEVLGRIVEAQPAMPTVTPKHIEEIKDILLWPVTEDDARTARDMLQSLHFDLSMVEGDSVQALPYIVPWPERMPEPRTAFQCSMNCSGVGLGAIVEQDCGDCSTCTIKGDPVAARDAELADHRDRAEKLKGGVA